MSELEDKQKFVEFWLTMPKDPFKAALEIFPENTNRALRIAAEWPKDPEVLEIKEKLLSNAKEGELSFLPSKTEWAREVWNMSQNKNIDFENKIKVLKLYADGRGFIEKQSNGPVVNVNQNRVIVVRDLGTDDEWETKAAVQQKALLNVSTSKH